MNTSQKTPKLALDGLWKQIVKGEKIKVHTTENGRCFELGLRPDESGTAQWYLHEVLKPEITEKRVGRYLVKLVGPRKHRPRGKAGFGLDCPESEDSILNDARAKVAWLKIGNRYYCIANNRVPIFSDGGLLAVPVVISDKGLTFERVPNQMDESRVSDFVDLVFCTPTNWLVCSNGGISKSGISGGASNTKEWHAKLECGGHELQPHEQADTNSAGDYRILSGYAARGLVFHLNEDGAKERLSKAVILLQNAGYVLNLVARGASGRLFLFARTSVAELAWVACIELAGWLVVDTKEKFDSFATSEQIDDLLGRATITYEDYARVLPGLRLDGCA